MNQFHEISYLPGLTFDDKTILFYIKESSR